MKAEKGQKDVFKMAGNRKQMKVLKFFSYINVTLLLLTAFFVTPVKSVGAAGFADDFSAGSSNWASVSGGWLAENGTLNTKELGNTYSTKSAALINDDFSTPNPNLTSEGITFSDNFTQSNGGASLWTPKIGSFSVANNEYVATGTLSIPTTPMQNLTNYRLTAKIKRNGVVNTWGYARLNFRLNMLDATHENAYVLLYRQTGVLDLYKSANGVLTLLKSATGLPSDNQYHAFTVVVAGSNIRVWVDKSESLAPEIAYNDSSYSSGGIGVGSAGWSSSFDDIMVESVTSNFRWTDKKGDGVSYVADGIFTLKNGSSNTTMTVPTASNSQSWKNYKLSTKMKLSATAGSRATILVRLNTSDNVNYNGYGLGIVNNGSLLIYKITNNVYTTLKTVTKPIFINDTNWHTVTVSMIDSRLSLWIDKSDTSSPSFSWGGLTDYQTGTIGFSSYASPSYLDDISVVNIPAININPVIMYTNSSSSTITLSSGIVFDPTMQLAVTNPTGQVWPAESTKLNNCQTQNGCSWVFPADFPGANLSVVGSYKISLVSGNDNAVSFFEVKEAPLLTFIDMSDTHITNSSKTTIDELNSFVGDVNNQKYFPYPNFVVVTGDVTDIGDLPILTQFKTTMDGLKVPYYPIEGGHDTNSETGTEKGHNWATTFGNDKFTYSWTVGDFLFLAMDDGSAAYGGFGTSMYSPEHKTWLQNILATNPTKKAFLFDHVALKAARDAGGAQNYWLGEYGASKIRPAPYLENMPGQVIANFGGHSHINGAASLNNIYYFQTTGFVNMDEYRYIEVYADRIESHIFKKSNYHYQFPSITADYWVGSSDSTHSTSTYSYGLPLERQFKLYYPTQTTSSTQDIIDSIAVTGSRSWKDYEYKADVMLGKEDFFGENIGGIVFRYQDNNNYYSAMLDSGSNTVVLQKKINGQISTLAKQLLPIDQDTFYTVKAAVAGNYIKIYINGVQQIEVNDGSLTTGMVGLKSYQAPTLFDNIVVDNVVTLDTAAPVVTSFIMPASAASRTVPITTFTASDDTGVVGYLITESSSTPTVSNPDWVASAPRSYMFSGFGMRTAYPWVKDAAGNISGGASQIVNIFEAPIITNLQSSVNGSRATITWNTNIPADAVVLYGITPSYTDSSRLSTSHSIILPNLTPGMTYHFQVINNSGITATSTDQTITIP